MFFNIIPNRLSVYKSSGKEFMIVTKITEHNNKIMIKRNISYYNHKKQKYIKRTELQQFDCEDYETISSEEDPYCKELKQYSKLIDTTYESQEYDIKLTNSDWLK